MHHRDLAAEHAHELHVVVDDDDGRLLVDLVDDAHELVGLGAGDAGGRLVEQQQPRPLREHEADLDELALAVRELADQAARDRARATSAASPRRPSPRVASRLPTRRADSHRFSSTVRPFITDGTCVLMPTPRRTIS